MFSFFNSITALIGAVVGFVVNSIKLIVLLFTQIPESIAFVFSTIAYLPTFLFGFVMAMVSLAIVFQIINHGG